MFDVAIIVGPVGEVGANLTLVTCSCVLNTEKAGGGISICDINLKLYNYINSCNIYLSRSFHMQFVSGTNTIEDYEGDLADLRRFLTLTDRERTKRFLNNEICRVDC